MSSNPLTLWNLSLQLLRSKDKEAVQVTLPASFEVYQARNKCVNIELCAQPPASVSSDCAGGSVSEQDAGSQLMVTVLLILLLLAMVIALANLIGAINVFG